MNESKTTARYAKLLAAYRESPGNHNRVAETVGCDLRTARSAWEHGWPRFSDWARPIREVLAEEQKQAKALRAQAVANTETQAAIDSVRVRAAEGVVIELARGAAGHLLRQTRTLLTSGQALAEDIDLELKKLRESGAADLRLQIGLLSKLGELAKASIDAAHECARLERTIMGDPAAPAINIQQAVVFSPEQRAHRLALLRRVVDVPADDAPALNGVPQTEGAA